MITAGIVCGCVWSVVAWFGRKRFLERRRLAAASGEQRDFAPRGGF